MLDMRAVLWLENYLLVSMYVYRVIFMYVRPKKQWQMQAEC